MGFFMSIFLKAELKTDVVGHGDGWISITQTLPDEEEIKIWLSVNQFETIFNHEKHLVCEALGTE
jgi:hypothetical protein